MDYVQESSSNKEAAKIRRRNLLKNIIAIKIQEIREIKRKPLLKDVLQKLRGKNPELVAQKLRMLYSKEELQPEKRDPRYEKLLDCFDRVKRSFVIQNEALDDITHRLDILEKRKSNILHKGPDYLEKLRKFREVQIEKEEQFELLQMLKVRYQDELKDEARRSSAVR